MLETAVASGLVKRELLSSEHATQYGNPNLPQASDVILSFGGDGTLLSTAHNVGAHQTPILGVNFGRLGFLADTEVSNLNDTIRRLEKGAYRIEERMVLEARFEGKDGPEVHWALNDFVLERSLMPQLISVEVCVDGAPLTTYWADGLIISTPTGSTAYALSVGGPILAPGSDVMVLTPIAPHTLTVRPLVLPASAIITADVQANNFVFAADGRSTSFEGTSPQFSIKRAQHSVRLIKLPEQDYFPDAKVEASLERKMRMPSVECRFSSGLGIAASLIHVILSHAKDLLQNSTKPKPCHPEQSRGIWASNMPYKALPILQSFLP